MSIAKSLMFSTGYLNIMILTERGGNRKTTLAATFAVTAQEMGANVQAVEVEQRPELSLVLPNITTSLSLPSLDEIQGDDQSENRALSPLFKALVNPGFLTVCDVGANLDDRVFQGMVRMGVARRLQGAGIDTAIVIPYYMDVSSVAAASRTARRAMIALPGAKIVFCHCETSNGAAKGNITASADWIETIQPLIDKNGMMRMPLLQPSVVQAFNLSKRDPLAFTEMTDAELAPFTGDDEFIADALRNSMKLFVDCMSKQIREFFRFQRQKRQAE